jgi:membrane-associated phospholipid phosphatase
MTVMASPTGTPVAVAAAGVNRTRRKETLRRNGLLLLLLEALWMALGTSTSVVVSGGFAIVMACRRRHDAAALTVAAFVGAIFNGILSKILKKVIRQARPLAAAPTTTATASSEHTNNTNKQNDDDSSRENSSSIYNSKSNDIDNGIIMTPRYGVGEEEGMPSSHSMSLAFIWALIALHYPPDDDDINNNPRSTAGHFHPFLFPSSRRLVVVSIALVYVLICATYRCFHAKRVHTWQQVVVGLTLGMMHARLFVQCGVQRVLSEYIMAHVLTAVVVDDNDHHDGEQQQRRILPAPLLAIPFVMTIMIGAKVDLRIMQWLSQNLHQKRKHRKEHAC